MFVGEPLWVRLVVRRETRPCGAPLPRTSADPAELDQPLAVAHHCARRAAAVLLEHWARPATDVRATSAPNDLVSAADLAAEDAIRDYRPTSGRETACSARARGDALRVSVEPGTAHCRGNARKRRRPRGCKAPDDEHGGSNLRPSRGKRDPGGSEQPPEQGRLL